jgi:hypothetical protein
MNQSVSNSLAPSFAANLPMPAAAAAPPANGLDSEAMQNIEALMQQAVQSMLLGNGARPGTALGAQANPAPDDDAYATLDQYSEQNDQGDLSEWSGLASGDQADSLERPAAALAILSGQPNADGSQPSPAQVQAATSFVNNNPSLKSALQNSGGLNQDGSVNAGKVGQLYGDLKQKLCEANNNIKAYQKKNPNADAQSLATARSAALLQAYEPIAGLSAGHTSNGKNGGYGGGKNGGGLVSKSQVADLQKNQGFSSALKSSAAAWSTDGAFDQLDRSGIDKATNKDDNLFDDGNMSNFIENDAPTDAASDSSFLQDASLQNVTGGTDISGLNQDVFANPDNYSPQQKAAVLVTLMKTLVSVQAADSDGLRNTDATIAALQKDIQTLARDPETRQHLMKTVPPAMDNLAATIAGSQTAAGVAIGGGAGLSLSGTDNSASARAKSSHDDAARDVKDGIDAAKDGLRGLNALDGSPGGDSAGLAGTLSNLARGSGFAGLGGDSASAAAGAAGGDAAAAGGEAAGEAGAAAVAGAAEAGTAAAEGGLIASGLAIGGATLGVAGPLAGLGVAIMAIVKAVQKHENQDKFADNVNPTLKQFGIPLPS